MHRKPGLLRGHVPCEGLPAPAAQCSAAERQPRCAARRRPRLTRRPSPRTGSGPGGPAPTRIHSLWWRWPAGARSRRWLRCTFPVPGPQALRLLSHLVRAVVHRPGGRHGRCSPSQQVQSSCCFDKQHGNQWAFLGTIPGSSCVLEPADCNICIAPGVIWGDSMVKSPIARVTIPLSFILVAEYFYVSDDGLSFLRRWFPNTRTQTGHAFCDSSLPEVTHYTQHSFRCISSPPCCVEACCLRRCEPQERSAPRASCADARRASVERVCGAPVARRALPLPRAM